MSRTSSSAEVHNGSVGGSVHAGSATAVAGSSRVGAWTHVRRPTKAWPWRETKGRNSRNWRLTRRGNVSQIDCCAKGN